MAAVRANVGHWIDVDAVTGGARTVGNIAAFAGGAWNTSPRASADVFIEAATNHENFTTMMTTPGPDGLTPQQALERMWNR